MAARQGKSRIRELTADREPNPSSSTTERGGSHAESEDWREREGDATGWTPREQRAQSTERDRAAATHAHRCYATDPPLHATATANAAAPPSHTQITLRSDMSSTDGNVADRTRAKTTPPRTGRPSTSSASASAAASAASVSPATASASALASVEDDVFDIEDFTVASPFEKFVSVIEEQLRSWAVGIAHQAAPGHSPQEGAPSVSLAPPPPQHHNPGWPLQQAVVTLSGRSFQLSLYHSSCALASATAAAASAHSRRPSVAAHASASAAGGLPQFLPLRLDHVTAASRGLHPISVWFGVCSFVLLTPAPTHPEPIVGRPSSHHPNFAAPSARRVSKNEASMLLSALSLACNNAQCMLAAFVAVDEGAKQLYWGRTCYGSVVRFDSRIGDELPPSLRHLHGLTEQFNAGRDRLEGRSAGQVQVGNMRTLIAASLAFQQETRKWGYQDIGALRALAAADDDSLPDLDNVDDGGCRWRDISEDHLTGFGTQWGPKDDPLTGVRLLTSWPFFPEGTFVDNSVYTDLDGAHAPNWEVFVDWRVDDSTNPLFSSFTPLTSALQILIDVGQSGSKVASLASVLGNLSETPESLAASAQGQSALAALTKDNGGGLGAKVSQPLNAFRAVQSSLKAHIEDANNIATHGASVSSEYIDGVMRELLDIEHTSPQAASPSPRPSPPAAAVAGGANASAFPFIPELPVDPFTTVGYPASPADPSPSIQLVPYGSLLSRFVFALLATSDTNQLTIRTVARMWSELVSELRFHFETLLPIPKLLSSDTPDFGCSILHQKIQMLQRCIRIQIEKNTRKAEEAEKRKGKNKKAAATPQKEASSSAAAGAAAAGKPSKATPNWKQPWTAWSEEKLQQSAASSSSSPAPPLSASEWGSLDDLTVDESASSGPSAGRDSGAGWGDLDISVHEADSDEESAAEDASRAAVGVDSVLPGLTLLLTGTPMHLPLTQEVRVMTSDKFDEQSEMFARMGTGPEAQRMRTEMQTAGLLSDMQAFKAANPGCILEDFVRWHSPKDWRALPVDPAHPHTRRGELTQRMRKRAGAAEGGINIWQTLWKSATPVAAADQKPLFDPAVEGEQLLNYLENIEPSLLFPQMIGIGLQNCIGLLARTRGVADQLQPVIASIQKLHHYLKHFNRGNLPQDLHLDFSECELRCARATSLLLALPIQANAVPAAPTPAAGASKKDTPVPPSSLNAGREMLTQLLVHGRASVGHSLGDRAQLSALLSGNSARSRPVSLFSTRPFNYARADSSQSGSNSSGTSGSGIAMDSAGVHGLPKPDWSELTFFAPAAANPNTNTTEAAAHALASSVSVFGSRSYVFQRFTSSSSHPASPFPLPKVRIATATVMHA